VNHVKKRDLHPRRLADVAAELRAYGKARAGSLVVSERRESPGEASRESA
jgi:hypothetical protein